MTDFECVETFSPMPSAPSCSSSDVSFCDILMNTGYDMKQRTDILAGISEKLRHELCLELSVDERVGYLYGEQRTGSVEFICTFARNASYIPETAALAISIMDQYVFSKASGWPSADTQVCAVFRVVAITSLHLAAKLNEVMHQSIGVLCGALCAEMASVINSMTATPEERDAAVRDFLRVRDQALRFEPEILGVIGHNPYQAFALPKLEGLCDLLECDGLTFGASPAEFARAATAVMLEQMVEGSHLDLAPSAFAAACALTAGAHLHRQGRASEDAFLAAAQALAGALPAAQVQAAVDASFTPRMPLLRATLWPAAAAPAAADSMDVVPSPTLRVCIPLAPSPPPFFEQPPSPAVHAWSIAAASQSSEGSVSAAHRSLFRANSASGVDLLPRAAAAPAPKPRFASEPGQGPVAGSKRKAADISSLLEEDAEDHLEELRGGARPSPLALVGSDRTQLRARLVAANVGLRPSAPLAAAPFSGPSLLRFPLSG